jgi:hypothetical protein
MSEPAGWMQHRQDAGTSRPLVIQPRLESWDRKGSRSQVALSEFLDHVEGVVQPDMKLHPPPWAIHLSVGLPAGQPLDSGGHDLDNYLFPIARRLGHARIASARADKVHGRSSVTLSSAQLTDRVCDAGWHRASASSRASASTHAWKAEIARAISQQTSPAPVGPVAMHLQFRVSPQRNWTTLWKPALDAMGPILGFPAGRPFSPYDDRVVQLGLHRVLDSTQGWRVDIEVWWKPEDDFVPGRSCQ